jgi:putative oxidoreductase
MLTKLLRTGNNKVLTTGRILLGILVVVQGGHGMLGWFAGANPADTLDAFLRLIGLPAPLIWLALLTDFFAGMGLLLGFFTRVDALCVAGDAVVGVVLRGFDPRLFTD